MKKKGIYAAIALSLVLSLPSFAGGRVETGTVAGTVLGTEVRYNVYLPEGYSPEVHYPVIYLLHGLHDTYATWMERGNMKPVADELIASGECVPVVIVMPNAGGPDTEETWNGYFNMPGWRYEDFFFSEFIQAVEQRYNAGGSKGLRAVMGLSMGGGGSTVYCQHHPDMFSSCYAMSPWLDNKGDYVRQHGVVDKLYLVCKSVCDNSAISFVENADEETLASLRTVKWFIDCGDDDFLFDLSVQFHKLMKAKKVKSELRVRDGVHNWEYWHQALRLSLPFASRNFSKHPCK